MIRDTLLGKLVVWFSGWTQICASLLLVIALVTSLAVIYSVHLTRQQYSELQELQAVQDYLDSEYERLLLEQSAWADYARIDQVSRDELHMVLPSVAALVVVRR